MRTFVREDILRVMEKINLNVNVTDIIPEQALSEQEIDSLDMMNLFFEIEETFSVRIANEAMSERRWETIRIRVSTAHSAASARLRLLREMEAQPASDAQAIWEEGVRAYREGVVVLGELVELLETEEERELVREQIGHESRRQVLEMYCSAGYFPEEAIDDMITGANE